MESGRHLTFEQFKWLRDTIMEATLTMDSLNSNEQIKLELRFFLQVNLCGVNHQSATKTYTGFVCLYLSLRIIVIREMWVIVQLKLGKNYGQLHYGKTQARTPRDRSGLKWFYVT